MSARTTAYEGDLFTHNREIHSWTSLYFDLHAQATETVLPVAHSANSVHVLRVSICGKDTPTSETNL